MLPREVMDKDTALLRDTYACKPDAPVIMKEFGFYSLERWVKDGIPQNKVYETLHQYGYNYTGIHCVHNMGGCTAEFYPKFEVKVLEDRGEHELEQDFAGRKVLYFKGRRDGFMPTYVDHPVKDMETFEKNCLWRMDPESSDRIAETRRQAEAAVPFARQGKMMEMYICGPYMYLRALIGAEPLLYMFYDDPDLIHRCMQQWYALNTRTSAVYQEYFSVDEILFDEDICYNGGMFISPDMWREFIGPYYQQLLTDIKARQMDRERHVYVQLATDGDCRPAIPLYREIGMDCISPLEVASGCDVVEIGEKNPGLVLYGGFDKRILAAGKDAIDREIDRIMPVMRRRGGYIPTCDHGVPEEVTFENWCHFRKRLMEYAN